MPTNVATTTQIEGIKGYTYGGTAPTESSGTRYVRVWHGDAMVGANNEITATASAIASTIAAAALAAAALAAAAPAAAALAAAALALDAAAAALGYHPRAGRLLDRRQPRGVAARRWRRVGSP